jgi:hypothetical protein
MVQFYRHFPITGPRRYRDRRLTWQIAAGELTPQLHASDTQSDRVKPRLYSKVWPMLSIFDSNKQKDAVGNYCCL